MAKVECELITQDAIDVEIDGSAGVLLQAKSVDITENGKTVVVPDEGFEGIQRVEINTNVPKPFECGEAVFDTNAYEGGYLYEKIKKINVSCIVTANTKSLYNTFCKFSGLEEIVGLDSWDTSSLVRLDHTFEGCSLLKSLDIGGWDSSNFFNLAYMFRDCNKLASLDLSGWDNSRCGIMISMFDGCKKLRTLIGNKTLQDVENGTVALRGTKVNIQTNSSPLRFSSILALANGLADLTGAKAQTLTISANSYENMYNDDDTTPTADVIAERQARIAAICATKNWNFAH